MVAVVSVAAARAASKCREAFMAGRAILAVFDMCVCVCVCVCVAGGEL
jgi:hypothetical protein